MLQTKLSEAITRFLGQIVSFLHYDPSLISTCIIRAREEELIYVLRKLLSLRLWPGCLWAALSDSPSQHSETQPGELLFDTVVTIFVTICVAVDVQLPLYSLIADATKRSPKAHLFHFYNILCEILSLPRSLPSSYSSGNQYDGTSVNGNSPLKPDSPKSDFKDENNARRLAYLCLLEIGKDIEAQ